MDWTYWHHLFNARQLLVAGLVNRFSDASLKFGLGKLLNANSRLSWWDNAAAAAVVCRVFDNQALNTLFNYGCRALLVRRSGSILRPAVSQPTGTELIVTCHYLRSA